MSDVQTPVRAARRASPRPEPRPTPATDVALPEFEPARSPGAFYHAGPALSLGAAAGGGNGSGGAVQFKLVVGRPGDAYEREADTAADKVVGGGRAPAITPLGPGALARMAAGPGPAAEEEEPAGAMQTLQRQAAEEEEPEGAVQPCAGCEKEEEPPGAVEPPRVQRQAAEAEEEEPAGPLQALQRQEAEEEEEPAAPVQALQRQEAEEEEEPAAPVQALQRQEAGEEEEPAAPVQAVQRQAAEEEEADGAVQPCANCEEKEERGGAVQRAAEEEEDSAAVQMSSGAGGVAHVLNHSGGGAPLAPAVREKLEPGLGADLSGVRVHSDGAAHAANRSLRARAFTHGQDIWLGPGESPTDTRLMAHEATHVMQQTGGEDAPPIQRAPADYQHGEDGGGVRSRLDARYREEVSEEDREEARRARRNGNNGQARQIDRRELAAKKGEVRGDTRPDVDRPAEEAPGINQSAAVVEREAETPPDKLVEGQEAQEPKQPEGPGDEAAAAADQAAGLVQQAYSAADSVPEPEEQPEIQPPEPVLAPVDAAGEPLPGDPSADMAAADLMDRVQYLRDQGTMMRAQAAEGHGNAEIVRGNVNKVSGEVSKAEEGIAKSKDHATYRQEVVGQADEALTVSKEKQATVAADAPGFQDKADEGKEDTGPMRSEAGDMAAENAANTPDDEEAAAKSREQGGQINQVGENSVTMDSAVSQTRERAGSLATDAARAAEKNTESETKLTETKDGLAQTNERLGQMEGQTTQARGQVEGLRAAPDDMHGQAAQLEEKGQQLIASSFELEAEIQQTQTSYAEGMRGVPAIEYLEPEEMGSPEGAGGEAAAGIGEAAPEEMAGEGAIQTLPDEEARDAGAPAGTATPAEGAATATPAAAPAPTTVTTAPNGSPAATLGGAPSATPAGPAPSANEMAAAAATGLQPGAEAATEPAAGTEPAGEEAPAGEEEEPAEAEAQAAAAAGPETAGGEATADQLAGPLDMPPQEQPSPEELLAAAPEGANPESVEERHEEVSAEEQARRDRLEYITQRLGKNELTKVGYGERLSIALGAIGNNYMNMIRRIEWPGFGGLARMLLDPRQLLSGVVGGLKTMLRGATDLFSLDKWREDPLGNLLQSAATIATGLTVVLGSITALAGLVAAIMGAILILSFGFAAPVALPVISVCTTIITTVGGWTIAVGKIALVLQALALIKNLIDLATADTAEAMARESEQIQQNVEGAASAVMSMAGARGATAGIRNVRGRAAGVIRASRRAGGAGTLMRATVRGAPKALRAAGRRTVRNVRRRAAVLPRRIARRAKALPGRAGDALASIPGRVTDAGRRVLAGAKALPGNAAALPGRAAAAVRRGAAEVRALPGQVASSWRRGRAAGRRVGGGTGRTGATRPPTAPRAGSSTLQGISRPVRIGSGHTLSVRRVGNRLVLMLCSNECGALADKAARMLDNLPANHPARRELNGLVRKARRYQNEIDGWPDEDWARDLTGERVRELTDELEGLQRRHPGVIDPDIPVATPASAPTPTPDAPEQAPVPVAAPGGDIFSRQGLSTRGLNPDQTLGEQLAGSRQLSDLQRSPNLVGVGSQDLPNLTPRQLAQMVEDGRITKKVFDSIMKTGEGRNLGGGG